MRRTIAYSAGLFLLISAVGLPAQQPTFRSKAELVIVDAVVVDKDGNAVRGLKASDFALVARKKPQIIETFEEVSHERAAGTSQAPALPLTLKLDVASNTTVQSDRLVMVFIDDLRIWRGRTDKAKALAHDIVTKLGNQASMAVVFTSREGSTGITQDRSVLLAAIDGMKARQTFRRPHQGFVKQGVAHVSLDLPIEFKLEAVNTAARASLQDYFDNLQVQESLDDAARMLVQEDRRRKAFVMISEGMDADLSGLVGGASNPTQMVGPGSNPFGASRSRLDGSSNSDTDLNAETGATSLLGMMSAMQRANIALYAIDPRGKVRAEDMMLESWPPLDCAVCSNPPEPPPAERVKNREDSQFAWGNPVRRAQAGLGFLSEAAGGFAVTDTDDLAGGLSRILEDLDHYYLLGFYPTDTSGWNSMHPVDLTVPGHPDYKVRFRRGYVPDAPSPPLKTKDPLAELAAGVMPKGDLPLRLTAMPLPGGGKTASVVVALEVTAPVGAMKEADSKLRDDVRYSVMVVDEKKSKVTRRTGRSATFSMRAQDPSQPAPDTVTYQIPLTIDLEPGRYQLRASAMSKKLDRGGSVYLDITVPDFSKTPLALTTIALGFADGARVPVGRTAARAMPGIVMPIVPPAQARAQNNQNPLPFEPTLGREFAQTDALRVYFEVARTNIKSTVALEIRVFDANNLPQMGYDRIVEPHDPGQIDLRVPLETLGPGPFTIRVVGRDSRNVARTEAGFIIK